MNIFGNRSINLCCIKYYCFFDNHSVQIYGLPAFEVTYIVSRGAFNSTHSLAVHDCHETGIFKGFFNCTVCFCFSDLYCVEWGVKLYSLTFLFLIFRMFIVAFAAESHAFADTKSTCRLYKFYLTTA